MRPVAQAAALAEVAEQQLGAGAGTEMPAPTKPFGMVMDLEQAKFEMAQFEKFMNDMMQEGVDYGSVSGVDKKFLWQPGAAWATPS